MKDITKDRKTYLFWILIIVGFLIRFIGLFFGADQNVDSNFLHGSNVWNNGLAEGYKGSYFPIAYIIFGLAYKISTFMPHLWWLPFKASNFLFEIGILFLLFSIIKKRRWHMLWMYWLNPWFFIPGSWPGSWDAPTMFFLLLVVKILDFSKITRMKFFWAGLCFGVALNLKPQSFAPLVAISMYLFIFSVVSFKWREAIQFFLGLSILPMLLNAYFFLYAKGATYLFQTYMIQNYHYPAIVGSEINIWHSVARITMYREGWWGGVYEVVANRYPFNILMNVAYAVFFLLLFAFSVKEYFSRNKTQFVFLKLFTFSLILLPQILMNSHSYHFSYASLFLIVLLLVEWDKRLFLLWLPSVAIHFYNIFVGFGLGRDIRIPIDLPREPLLTVLGIVQFLLTLGFIYVFFVPVRKKKLRPSTR